MAFVCNICKAVFARRYHLTRHTDSVHRHKYWAPVRQTGGSLDNAPPHLEDHELRAVYRDFWSAIRSYRHDYGKVQQIHNRRLISETMRDVEPELWTIFRSQRQAFKVNFSYGFVLRHTETGEYRYFHASQNNARLLDVPRLVRNQEDFSKLLEDIRQEDVLEFTRLQRPDTKWTVHIVTNLTVYVNPIHDHPIGSPVVLPDYIKRNMGIMGLVKDRNTGRPYDDKLCIFRCVALALGYTLKNMKKFVTRQAEDYPKGVTLGELSRLERRFKVNINVWQLAADGTAQLMERSQANHDTVCNINLYEDHFSYIKDLEKYSR